MRTEAKRGVWLWVVLLGGCTSGGTPSAPPDVRDSQTPPGEVGLDAIEEAAAPDVVDVTAPDQSVVDAPGMETTAADAPGMDTPAADAVDAGDVVAEDVAPMDVADVVAEDVAQMDAPDGDGASADARLDALDVVDVVDAAVDRPDVTPGVCPTTFTTCEACLEVPGCGMCDSGEDSCRRGGVRGPSDGTRCDQWLAPGSPAVCTMRPSTAGLNSPCPTRQVGEARECGWTTLPVQRCTPGLTYRVGCVNGRYDAGVETFCGMGFVSFGACTGDPMIRICQRDGNCLYHNSLTPTSGDLDNFCAQCPMVTITCPPSGVVSIMKAPSDSASTSWFCDPRLELGMPL